MNFNRMPNRTYRPNSAFSFSDEAILKFLQQIGYTFVFQEENKDTYVSFILKEIIDPYGKAQLVYPFNGGWETVDAIFQELILQHILSAINKVQPVLLPEL